MANYEVESADLAVNIAGAENITANISDAQPLAVTIGTAAEMEASQAVVFVESGKAEVQKAVAEQVAIATEKAQAAADSASEAANSESIATVAAQNAADSATEAQAAADRAEAAADLVKIDNDTGLEHHYDVIDYYGWKEIVTDNIYYTENYPPEVGDTLYKDVGGTITQYTTVEAYSSDLDIISWLDSGSGFPKSADRDDNEDLSHDEAEASDAYVPTQKAVKTYVDNEIEDCATAAQGAKADTALQPNDNITELTNNAGYITDSALSGYATESWVESQGYITDGDIPSKTSDLENDSGFITSSDLPTVGSGVLTLQKNSTNIDTFSANATENKTINITVPTTAADVSALPSSTKYGASIDLSLNTTDYKLTLTLKDQDGTALNSKTVDFPIESVVVNGSYDSTNQKIVLTLQNGNTIDIPVGALVAGLQTEITSSNKLDADLVSDSTSTNKFVTTSEKSTWNGKQDAISDLSTIRSGASAGATAVQPADLATVATSGKASDLTNDSGFITSAALSGYATETWVGNQGYITNSALTGYATQTWVGQQGYITGITSSDVTTALGYTPYDSSNPAGYTSNVGTVTSVNNVSPVNGNVSLNIPTVNNATLTITQGGVSKGTFTANASSDVTIALDAGGGGGTTYTAGDGIDITNNVISVDGEQTSEVDISDFVHIAGAETITGEKTVMSANLKVKSNSTTTGTAPSSTQVNSIQFIDSNDRTMGWVYSSYSAQKDAAVRLQVKKSNAAGDTSYDSMGIVYPATGNPYGFSPDFMPKSDNTYTLGSASKRWKQLFAGTTTISTSDERLKQGIESVPDAVLDAWGEVEFYRYKFNDSVAEKGFDNARYHTGMVAQRIASVFTAHGLNAADYGLLCFDEWEAEPAELDEDGQIITPAKEAGNRYSLRYEECLCMEAAYQRRRADRIEARLAALEARAV